MAGAGAGLENTPRKNPLVGTEKTLWSGKNQPARVPPEKTHLQKKPTAKLSYR